MNRSFGVVVFGALLGVLFIQTGCRARQERDEQRTRQGADLALVISTEQERERVRLANEDLANRVAYYRGLEGVYEGVVFVNTSAIDLATSASRTRTASSATLSTGTRIRPQLRIRLTAANIPSDYQQVRERRESEILAQINELSFYVDLSESFTESVRFTCSASGVKPDLSLGIIRFTCQSASTTPARTYILALDYTSSPAQLHETYSRSHEITSLLLHNQLSSVPAMNVEIASSLITLRGRIERVTHGPDARESVTETIPDNPYGR